MNPKPSSPSFARPPHPNHRNSSFLHPSSLRRRQTSGSDAPSAHDADPETRTDAVISEEIAKIKRYEDFTTIDWVQDAAREALRRRAKRKERAGFWEREGQSGNGLGGRSGRIAGIRGMGIGMGMSIGKGRFRRRLAEAYDAGQAWIVVTLVGAAIGLNAAFLNIVTEWLSDIKLGYCETAFYLNESFCCWGAESGCDEWHRWSGFGPLNYFLYILFAALFSLTAAVLVKSFAPYAAGSGISEIKCIIAGFVMKGFLGAWTLVIKSIGLPLAIASGLSVGKEGPSVHYAVCTGNVISRFFDKYRRNAAKTREILSASAAAGVGVAFGSPIGGVLFSLEEMSSYFPLKTMWRSYFCALVATAVLAAMNPFRTGQLVMFQVKYDRSWHAFEILFYIIVGVFGGLYGAFVIKWNLRVQAFRKKYLAQYPVIESVTLAVFTAILCYPNMFLRLDMTESMEILFRECEGDQDYNGLCARENRWWMILSLAFATTLRVFLVIISYGCKVPAGIFVPSMAIGAAFGRMVGIGVQALQEAFPTSAFFSACEPDGPCITPGTYAFLGAAAALSGIMHITVSVVVIMFELTGALTYILPTMIVVGVTKAVSERFGKGGIADRAIWFNGYPFLDNKEEHTFGVPVSRAMATKVVALPATGLDIRAVERIMADNRYQGYPVVEDAQSKVLIGYIGLTELRYAIDRAKHHQMAPATAKVIFENSKSRDGARDARRGSASASTLAPPTSFDTLGPSFAAPTEINLSRFVDPTPLAVHPRLPLETVMELFKKMGPRVILIEYRGKLVGLVTVKDCLKYQFKVEAQEEGEGRTDQSGVVWEEREQKLWELMRRVGEWVNGRLGSVGRVLGLGRLSGSGRRGDIALGSPTAVRSRGVERDRERDGDGEVELEPRDGGG